MSRLTVDARSAGAVINRNLYGNFSEHLGHCIYGGVFVGEDSAIPNVNGMRTDVVEALRAIRLPVLRWPGGCFADEYHWKDGIGPRGQRKKMVNTHWGGVTEDNSFGTHEFMELCRQIGCEPYINGNLGSGTVQEMSEWMEYLTFDGVSPMAQLRAANGHPDPWRVKYFGVGNENWGCGGNMRPSFYADNYRRYQTYVRSYGENRVFKIACGPNGDDYDWTREVMEIAGRYMQGLSLHYYTVGGTWEHKHSATQFTREEYYELLEKALFMEELIVKHTAVMDRFDPEHRVGLVVDEWGTWHQVEPGTDPGFLYQQNTMRDALVAAVTLNIFNRHADRVVMANLAQLVNVLQAVLLTRDDRMVKTPTYHVFDLYQEHQDARLLACALDTGAAGAGGHAVPALSASASVDADGEVHITVANLADQGAEELELRLEGCRPREIRGRILAGKPADRNDFDCPSRVEPRACTVRPEGEAWRVMLPGCSVAALTVR